MNDRISADVHREIRKVCRRALVRSTVIQIGREEIGREGSGDICPPSDVKYRG